MPGQRFFIVSFSPVRNQLLALLFLVCGFQRCVAQQTLEKLTYQLANDILMDLQPQKNPIMIKGASGHYEAQGRLPATETFAPMLLLDQPALIQAAEDLVMAGNSTPERALLLEYFSAGDIAYMQIQLPLAKQFVFKQYSIRQPGVEIIRQDTLVALNKRLDWQAVDTLQKRYGSRRVYAISGLLFSLNHWNAISVISTDDGWNIYVYQNTGTGWYRKATLQKGVY